MSLYVTKILKISTTISFHKKAEFNLDGLLITGAVDLWRHSMIQIPNMFDKPILHLFRKISSQKTFFVQKLPKLPEHKNNDNNDCKEVQCSAKVVKRQCNYLSVAVATNDSPVFG